MRLAGILLTCTVLHGGAYAADDTMQRLGKATEQYAKCLDNAFGAFANEEEGQAAARRLSGAMLRNIRTIVAEERKGSNPNIRRWVEILGEEAFIGYLFKSFSDVSEEYRTERRTLEARNNFIWRRTDQQLWSKYGCDAIYSQLPR
jgi:hypothetical protein